MRREWLLLAATVVATVALALGLIRWLAPQLLGVPMDLQVVQVDERVVPFYENVFRDENFEGDDFLIRDPYTVVRARPLFPNRGAVGPNDLLGFRNAGVPSVVDVVAIGDSQTYGTGVAFEEAWPRRLRALLPDPKPVVYGMAVGGWGAVQYLDMLHKARVFHPKLVVVALYTGNDANESFRVAYGVERWHDLRPDPALTVSDLPKTPWPPPSDDVWTTALAGGPAIAFTPRLRLVSIGENPAVDAGWEIMARVARAADGLAALHGFGAVFTILPTKELVYAKRLRHDGVALDPVYAELVEAERRRLERLAEELRALHRVEYVDVLGPLQDAALAGSPIYPVSPGGHPLPAGHEVIASALAEAVRANLLAESR